MAIKMKPNLRFLLLVAVIMSLVLPTSAFAAYSHQPVEIVNPASPIQITVNGKNVKSDITPKFTDGKIWVSAEAIAHYLYAVFYESIDGKAFTLKNDYYEMTATYGSSEVALKDGSTVTTDMPFKEGIRSFIPLDTLMYAFEATYTWDAASNTAKVLYDENRHLTAEAAIPVAVPGVDITAVGKSRDGYYSIPSDDPNAEVTVWRKSADPANYVIAQPRNTGNAWLIAPKPGYNAATGAFEGGLSYLSGGGSNDMIRVRIHFSDGRPDKEFKTTVATSAAQSGYSIPNTGNDLLLRTTFNNVSVYLNYTGYTTPGDTIAYKLPTSPVTTIQVVTDPANEVQFRKVGTATWEDGLSLAWDSVNKQFRGSIVGLEADTDYEVKVKVLKDASTYTGQIRTWKENVPIARDIPIASIYEPGKPLSVQGLRGSENGYIRIIGDGSTVIEVTDEFWEAVVIAQSEYVILENLIIRGGKRSAISVLSSSHHIRIVNSDISHFGREATQYLAKQTVVANADPNLAVDLRTGQSYTANATPVNNDSGIFISDASNLVIEKNYIHDARTKTNAWNGGGGRAWYPEWDDKHPQGVSAMYARGGQGVVIRYNDIVGSDDHRFNDAIETWGNGEVDGGVGKDSDVYGNYFAYTQDDSVELEGSDMNVRFYNNKIEGVANGVGLDTNYVGPIYLYRNVLTNLGDEWGLIQGALKHGAATKEANMGLGANYLFNNTILSSASHITRKDSQIYRPYYRNNIIESMDSPLANGQVIITIKHIYNYPGASYDYDLFNGSGVTTNAFSTTGGPPPIVEPNGITGDKIGTPVTAINPDSSKKATFTNRAEGDLSQTSGSLGFDKGTTIPNFVTSADYAGAAPDIGAIESGKDVIVPTRPTALRSDDSKYQLNVTGNTTQQVVIKTAGIPTGTKYDLRKNSDYDWFTVTNAEGNTQGTITQGVDLVLTVTGYPKQIGKNFLGEQFGTTITKGLADLGNTKANVLTGQPAKGKGAFLVKLDGGLSLPISVYVTEGNYDTHFNLTYKYNDGVTSDAMVTVHANGASLGEIVTPQAPTRANYNFVGWFDETYANKFDFSKAVEADTVLYAKWQPVIQSFTVAFNSNGGTAVAAIADLASGATIAKPADPTRSGYAFEGWYTNGALQNAFNFATDVITQSITLYAKWTALDTAIPQTWDQAGVDAVLNNPAFAGMLDLSSFATSPTGNVTIHVPVNKSLTIKGNSNVEFVGIAVVGEGNNALTINNLKMKSADAQAKSALYFASSSNTLTLEGTNVVTTVHSALIVGNGAGIGVPVGSALTIQAADASSTLAATGAIEGAGIGGGKGSAAGAITIAGGKITATAGGHAAGIGGGRAGAGGDITITGGTISLAKGGSSSAGIGGGNGGGGGNITISGGTVTATGANGAAGIGDGVLGTGGSITITGGTVTANGGSSGAGIGGASGNIAIGGGTVTATGGGSAGAGIGGSTGNAGGNITITGGTIHAVGGGNSANAAAGIGGGKNGAGGNIIISGGTITATGGGVTTAIGAGIGGGENGASGNILIYGENTQVTAIAKAASAANVGAGSGGSALAGNVFVALPKGKLRNGSTDLGNTVAFSSATGAPGALTADLPFPLNTAPFPASVGVVSNLSSTPTNLSVITNLADQEVVLSYPNATSITKTGAELVAAGAAVAFEKPISTSLVVNFSGVENAMVEYYKTSWINAGTYSNSAVILFENGSLPTGKYTVRVRKGGMSYTFPGVTLYENQANVFNVPVDKITVNGIHGESKLSIVQSDWVYQTLAYHNGDTATFNVFANQGVYELQLINSGFHKIILGGVSAGSTVDISSYFYTVTVPQGVSTVRLQSNNWIINPAQAGSVIPLLKTNQLAKMSYVYNGQTTNVEFLLDGTDPFAAILTQ
ncbi:InlB B-repeat-containing protein [Paenibacillus qinlingensis]|uniref:Repeat protein (TIGR02543 family) n=1 Tax=Paenibacillus qinlingensis TaxID=1837343 RepID=A0ABU1P0A4_9BACL|nr:InlB B-repeat-containing protein [Paenibacillus qinlingensis]MDR6553182.1 putative repeat protein (TIGR02543 family) [Paenibacillus qinlingensis]